MRRLAASRRTLATVLALGLTLLILYVARGHVVALLRAPHPCGHGSGCVDVPIPIAALAMFGFDALLAVLAVWQLCSGGLVHMPERAPSSKWQWSAGLTLLAVAALAGRFILPELRQFRWDEADIAWLALGGLLEGQLALTGIVSSIHIPNPPGAVYLLAPVLAFYLEGPGAPEALVNVSGILGAATSLLCAWFTRRWTGSARAGLAAGCVYALGFWTVYLGRRMWQQLLLPPFTILFFDALLLLAIRRKPYALIWAAGWLALIVQLHYVSATLLPLLLTAAWQSRRSISLRTTAMAGALCVALLAPFLWWEASFDTVFVDVRKALNYSQQQAQVDIQSLEFVLNLASAGLVEQHIEPFIEPFHLVALTPIRAAGAGAVLLGIGLLVCAVLATRSPEPALRAVALSWLAWIVVPPLFLLRHNVSIAQSYFYHVLPGIAAVIGVAVCWPDLVGHERLRLIQRAWRTLGPAMLGVYAAGSLLVLVAVLAIVERVEPLHYDVPLGHLSAAGQAAYSAWRKYGEGLPVLIGAQSRDVDKMRIALGPGVPALGFDDCRELAAPTWPIGALVYFLGDDTPAAEYLLGFEAAELLAAVPRPSGSSYRVFLVPSQALEAQQFPDGARWNRRDCVVRYVQS